MRTKRILIVDDDQDILRMLEYGLRKLGPGYEIITAKDIFSAIDEIEEYRFDLVLTDYMMPGMTGVDLARAARRMSPDTQVVLMTAYGTNQLRKGAAEKVQLDPKSDVTLKTMLEQAQEAEVELRVCQQSLALHEMTMDDVIDGVEILGATSIIDLSLEADHVMYF